MNWTEGALARHSRRKSWNPSLARQREYFARARARNSKSPNRQRPFVPSYIPRSTPQRSSAILPVSSSAPSFSSDPRQNRNSRNTLSTIFEAAFHDKRKASPSEAPSLSPQNGGPRAKIEAKRRKLLQQSDWTGLSFSRPPELNFEHNVQAKSARGHSSKYIARASMHDKTHTGREGRRHDTDHDHESQRYPGSIRLKIGDRKLRWSRHGGSIRTALTTRGSATAQSTSATSSMPSSPPVSVSAVSLSSPILRSSDLAKNQISRRAKIWARQSPITESRAPSNVAPFVPDGPRYVVQSVPPNILHPTPKPFRPFCLEKNASPRAETIAGSTVADAGQLPRRLATDPEAESEWRAFFCERLLSNDQKRGDEEEEMKSMAPLSPQGKHDGSETLPSASRAGIHNSQDEERSYEALTSSIAMPAAKASSIQLREQSESANGSHSHVPRRIICESPRALDLGRSDAAASDSLLRLAQDPSIEALLSRQHKPQNMIELLEKQLHLNRQQQTTKPWEKTDQSVEEELWRRFIFDDDPVTITQRAQQAAVKETKRQVLEATSTRTLEEQDLDICDLDSELAKDSACGTISSSVVNASGNESPDRSNAASIVAECGSPEKESEAAQAASIVAKCGSPDPEIRRPESFRIHVPTPFVGRLAGCAMQEDGSRGRPYASHTKVKASTGSKRKWRSDRPEIRAMPDFEEDPIEEEG